MVLHGRQRQLDETVWPIEPHTTLKHLAYRVYLQCWMAKILTKFQYATIVDAFSGPGVYTAGQPGSPVVAARAFLEHKNLPCFGRLRILCCEEREDRVTRLRREIQKLSDSRALEFILLTPGSFDEHIRELKLRSQSPKQNYPVLWILDPFNIKAVSMNHLRQCLAGLRDEVVLTFFVDEMYRWAEKNQNMGPALTRQYGNESWHDALRNAGESARKQAFTSLFRSALEESTDVLTSSFGVCAKNATSRYELVFATHSEKGLECWNAMAWRIDRITGKRSSADRAEAPDLFNHAEITELEEHLLNLAGQEVQWNFLTALVARAGYKETHLRQALSSLRDLGLAFRTSHLDANTPWPSGCTIQIHSPSEFKSE